MIAAFIISAIALGFLGSFHCVGMCGPIALSLPVQHLKGLNKLYGILLYNSGRIATYAILGMVFGTIGLSFRYFGWQQWLSIILGGLLLFSFIIQIAHIRIGKKSFSFSKWNHWVTSLLAPLFRNRKKHTLFLIGFLNGLLPCGLVYMALAGAIATGYITYSAVFMAAFGAGTLPAMIMASYAAGWITLPVRNKIRKAMPYMVALMGILLILRGMDIHIPIITPHIQHAGAVSCP
mgnify:FL=1